MVLTTEECRGVFSIIPACATPDAASPEARDTVDVDKLATLCEGLVRAGVNGILTTGTLGEGHTLLWDEHKKLIQTVVDVVNHRLPVFTGTTSLNTRRIIEKTRWAQDVGSDGVLNGVPMWLQQSVENAVQCYIDLAEACPDMAIMIYHNPPAFRVTIPPAAFKRLAKVRNIVAVKQAVTELNQLTATIRACGDDISVLMSDRCCYPAMKFGARGVWSTRSSANPYPVIALYRACAAQRWDEADAIQQEIAAAWPPVTMEEFHIYDTPLMKKIIDVASGGLAGPTRPPFRHLPTKIEEAALWAGQRWAELGAKYRSLVEQQAPAGVVS